MDYCARRAKPTGRYKGSETHRLLDPALVTGALAAMDATTHALRAAASDDQPPKPLFARQVALILEHGGLLMREATATSAQQQQPAASGAAAPPPASTAAVTSATGDTASPNTAKRPHQAFETTASSSRRAPPLPLTELPPATVSLAPRPREVARRR